MSVWIAAGIAIVAELVFFKIVLGLPYLRLPLFGAIFIFYVGFFLYTSNIFSKDEARSYNNAIPDKIFYYKSNSTYVIESIVAILILLVPITALLVTMLFNQTDIFHTSWLVQIGITIGGFIFLNLIQAVYHIGKTYSIGEERSPKQQSSQTYTSQTRTSQTYTPHVGDYDSESYNEAVKVVESCISNILGIDNFLPTDSFTNNLGADILDCMEIIIKYDEFLLEKFPYLMDSPIEPPIGSISGKKWRLYDNLRVRHMGRESKIQFLNQLPEDNQLREEYLNQLEEFYNQVFTIFSTVEDHYDFLATLIFYYRYRHIHR